MPKTIQNLNLPSQIESSRCVLKQHTLDEKYIQLWVDKINENLEWFGTFLPYFEKCRTYQEQYEYFKMLLKGDKEINYAIFDKATNELIGSVGVFNLETQDKKASLEISIMFFKKYAGQGYGQDIFNILEQNLTTKGITYIILKIHKDNIRSQKLAIRTGYVLDKSIFSNDSEFLLYKKNISDNAKKQMPLNIKIPTPTLEQAYALFLQNIKRIDWYEENERPYFLNTLHQMNKPLIEQMISERALLKTQESKFITQFQKPFEQELYHPERYNRIRDEILSYKDVFDKIYKKFKLLNNSWGFVILPEYVIDLNMYVGNGSYNAKTGHILLGIKGGGIQISMATIKLIMHEMIHLGIENLIVHDKSGNLLLTQNEKERIVDNLCQYVGKGIFDESLLKFQPQTEKYAYMDKFCIGQPRHNLVAEIQKYLQEKGL